MTFLIDTHIFVWYSSGDSKLSQIQNPLNKILVSKASLWEIAIKVSLKKLQLGVSFENLEKYLQKCQFETLEFEHKDLQQLVRLPLHHRDPFDRLIISQAITNNYTIITDDPKFHLYPAQLLQN